MAGGMTCFEHLTISELLVASGSTRIRDRRMWMVKVFVGLDWAEDHHDVFVEDDTGRRLGAGRLPDGVAGIVRFHELVADHVEEPAQVVIATESDRGLFINALVAAGYTVLAINPMSTARYRERYSTSGAKSDPGDAKVLADLARTDAHMHRSVAGDSELGEAIKVLARGHQSLIWTRQRQATSSARRYASSTPPRSTPLRSWQGATRSPCSPSHRHRPWGVSCREPRSRPRYAALADNAASTNAPSRSRLRCDRNSSKRRH